MAWMVEFKALTLWEFEVSTNISLQLGYTRPHSEHKYLFLVIIFFPFTLSVVNRFGELNLVINHTARYFEDMWTQKSKQDMCLRP
jgi:hypothetical protein